MTSTTDTIISPEALEAAKRRVPFAWGIVSSPGGMVHDWKRCAECLRLRRWSLGPLPEAVAMEGNGG